MSKRGGRAPDTVSSVGAPFYLTVSYQFKSGLSCWATYRGPNNMNRPPKFGYLAFALIMQGLFIYINNKGGH